MRPLGAPDVRIDMQGQVIRPGDGLLIIAPVDLDEDLAEQIATELRKTFGDRVLVLAGDFTAYKVEIVGRVAGRPLFSMPALLDRSDVEQPPGEATRTARVDWLSEYLTGDAHGEVLVVDDPKETQP